MKVVIQGQSKEVLDIVDDSQFRIYSTTLHLQDCNIS